MPSWLRPRRVDRAITGGARRVRPRPADVPYGAARRPCLPAFSPEHAERLQAVMPSAQIHLVPGSPHGILARDPPLRRTSTTSPRFSVRESNPASRAPGGAVRHNAPTMT
jgi:hypothetical protein